MCSCDGFLDCVANRTVYGWAWDATAPTRHLEVGVYVNEEHIGTVTADRFRQDLAENRIGDGRHGFEFVIPDRIQKVYHAKAVAEGGCCALPCSRPEPISKDTNTPLPEYWKDCSGRLRLPSVFILGSAKCGTTSLHAYLDKHPDIAMSHPKEPFYFEAEYAYGPTYYFNKYFSHWRGERVVGEARHRNLYLPYVPGRVFAYNPDARLIAVLRNPSERAISHWWHWYSRGKEALPLKEALLADWERISSGARITDSREIDCYAGTLDADGKGMYRTYLDSGYYSEQLIRYIEMFGRERMCILLFDDLVHDPARCLAEVFRFLDVDPACAKWIRCEVHNRSEPGMFRYLDSSTADWLIGHYRKHNRILEDLLGRKLDGWNALRRQTA